MSIDRQNILLGLPQTGKSSFIGALWHVIESRELNSFYTISTRPENRDYLNALRSSWFNCKPPERNKTEAVRNLIFHLRETADGKESTVEIPDVSGETYRQIFESRKVPESFNKLIADASGLILFIHPANVSKPATIMEANAILGESAEDELPSASVSWSHEHCPTQIILVDLLQMAQAVNQAFFNISVIVSAWDLILDSPDESVRCTPAEWLQRELPLLSQFLMAHGSKYPFQIFGVSAQGGSYEGDNTQLQNMPMQSQRIRVQTKNGISHDITLPLKWLFDENGGN